MTHTNPIEEFEEFVVTERCRYEGDESNRVGFTLGQVGRYLRFVEIPRSRYQTVNREVVARFGQVIEEARSNPGNRELTPEEIAKCEVDSQRHILLHFEIESFFQFAKLLLDKVAHCIEDFFGSVRGTSLRSHDKWCKCTDEYSRTKALEMPDAMMQTMLELRSLVTDYRDKQITHFRNPRALHGTNITSDGATQIATSTLYPKDSDKSSASPTVDDVAGLLELYVQQFRQLIERNRTRSRYKLRAIPGDLA